MVSFPYYVVDQQNTGNMVMEADKGSSLTSAYIYGNGLLARVNNKTDSLFYYHFDFRGSVIAITNQNGEMVQYYNYDDYGKVYDKKGSLTWSNPFQYVGKYGVQSDDSDLYYMKARYYQPSTGRFLSEDPVWNTNLFVYADDDPVNNIDPEGKNAVSNFYKTKIKTGYVLGTKHVQESNDWYREQYTNSVINNKPKPIYLVGVGITSLWTPENFGTTLGAFSLALPGLTGMIGKTGAVPLIDMRRKINILSKNLYSATEIIGNYNTFNETMVRYKTIYEKK